MRILNQPVYLSDRWTSSHRFWTQHQRRSAQNYNEAGPVPVPQCMLGNMAAGKLLCCVKSYKFLDKSVGNKIRFLPILKALFLIEIVYNSVSNN